MYFPLNFNIILMILVIVFLGVVFFLQEFSYTKEKLIKHTDLCMTAGNAESGSPIVLKNCHGYHSYQVGQGLGTRHPSVIEKLVQV